MAEPEHLEMLLRGADAWNRWRQDAPHARPDLGRAALAGAKLAGAYLAEADLHEADLAGCDLAGAELAQANLSHADLRGADLSKVNLTAANLREARLSGAKLFKAKLPAADLSGANLAEADIRGGDLREASLKGAVLQGAVVTVANLSRARLLKADLFKANLSASDLRAANLSGANLSGANLTGANLAGARLKLAHMAGANLERANLTGCNVYGTSAWAANLRDARQLDLVITDASRSVVALDGLDLAQFVSLLLTSQSVHEAVQALSTSTALVLGRYTSAREGVLEALRAELRGRGLTPVLFQCDKPVSAETHEAIVRLGRLARFVVADTTGAKNVLHELYSAVPVLPSVPVVALMPEADYEPSLVTFFKIYPWFMGVFRYGDEEELLEGLGREVVGPAEKKAREGQGRTARPR
jgi:uncharacterized protein YjbI with pentapeptide repeats